MASEPDAIIVRTPPQHISHERRKDRLRELKEHQKLQTQNAIMHGFITSVAESTTIARHVRQSAARVLKEIEDQ